MKFYRRRLPHLSNGDQPVFLTWSLFEALPANRCFPRETVHSAESFGALDHLLDASRNGPLYLRRPEIAGIVAETIRKGESAFARYALHSFVMMPNHVHMLVSPHVPLAVLTRTIKSYTAKRANELLGRTGNRFWQEESYDHLVRNRNEFRTHSRLYREQSCAGGPGFAPRGISLVQCVCWLIGAGPEARRGTESRRTFISVRKISTRRSTAAYRLAK